MGGKKLRITGQDRIKSGQRILGDSDFVDEILAESEETLTRKYRLKNKGITYEKVVEGVSVSFDVDKGDIIGKGRQGIEFVQGI